MNRTRFRPILVAIAALLGVLLLPAASIGAQELPPPPPPPPPGGMASAGYLHPLTPARVLDTRTGTGAPAAKVGPGQEIALQVTGRGGVPANAGAVVLNVTVTEPTTAGYLTVYPSGANRPTASNLNFTPGQTVPNLVIAKVGTDGKARIFNSSGTTHVVADVMGWYDDIFSSFPNLPAGGSRQQGIAPTRLLDTRANGGPVGPAGQREVQVTGVAGIPADATAVVLNVTVTQPTSGGYLTVHPAGTNRPTASNLNFSAGQTVPNLVIAKVGAGGRINLFSSAGAAHVVIDATAFYAPTTQALGGGELNARTPSRVLDTRTGTGAPAAKIGPGKDIALKVTGVGGVPDLNVDSVVLNVTVTEPTSGGYLTVHPSDRARPTASNLNFTPGQTVPNLVIAKVSNDGKVRIFNSSGTTHVIADVVGWHNGDTPSGPGPVPFEAAVADSPDIRSGAATETIPAFASEQREFWAANDPLAALAASEPEPLLERGGSQAGDAMYAAGEVPFQIWDQRYSYFSNPRYDLRIGRLVYWVPSEGRWSNCTATMVARNLAITAAHCVVNRSGGRNTNLAFFAGLEGTTAFGGIHTNVVDYVFPVISGTGQAAFQHRDYLWSADYAFVKFGPTGGSYPGDTVGWHPMKVNPALNWLKSYGYPSEGNFFSRNCSSPQNQLDAACFMYETWGRYGGYQRFPGGWYEIGFGSDMSGGSSGGPVFANDNGVMRLVSVNSNGQVEKCDRFDQAGMCIWRRQVLNMWGPYFNQTMLNIHQAHRVG
jgi:V8-like Glu-specific endopeptidase